MSKIKKTTQKKQEEIDTSFSFKNLGNTENLFPKKIIDANNKTSIRFKIHKDYMTMLFNLKSKYALKNQIYYLSNDRIFKICVLFLYDKFEKEGILKNYNENFKKAMIKRGRRKKNERTFKNEDTESIVFLMENNIADKYMDLMFSFILNNPNDDLSNSHHSRTYFFYDFLDLINNNKKDFFNF